jgi:hypothetical protein
VEISKMKTWREIFPGGEEIRRTEMLHLKPKSQEEEHPEAIGAGFVARSGSGEVWPDTLAGSGEVTSQKVMSGRQPIEIEMMRDTEAISKTTHSEEEEDAAEAEEEPEEEIIQLLHRGTVHSIPYSQVRSF